MKIKLDENLVAPVPGRWKPRDMMWQLWFASVWLVHQTVC